ncbi:hypothetical protein SMICM17S_08978 [Streptomyces microflavus]
MTGFAVLDGVLTGEVDAAWDAITRLILPAIALASIRVAVIARMTRASVREAAGRGLRPHQLEAKGGHAAASSAGRPCAARRGAPPW